MAFKSTMKAGTDVWCSRSTDGLPNHHIRPLMLDMFASYSGPDKGLAVVPELPIVQPVSPANQHLADSIPCACCDSLTCHNDPDPAATSPRQPATTAAIAPGSATTAKTGSVTTVSAIAAITVSATSASVTTVSATTNASTASAKTASATSAKTGTTVSAVTATTTKIASAKTACVKTAIAGGSGVSTQQLSSSHQLNSSRSGDDKRNSRTVQQTSPALPNTCSSTNKDRLGPHEGHVTSSSQGKTLTTAVTGITSSCATKHAGNNSSHGVQHDSSNSSSRDMTHDGSGSAHPTKHSVESPNINGHRDSVNNGKVQAVNGISLANTATTGTGDMSDNAIDACHTSSPLSIGESDVTIDSYVDHNRVTASTDVTARPPNIDNLGDVQSEEHDCKSELNNAKDVKPSTDGSGEIRKEDISSIQSTDEALTSRRRSTSITNEVSPCTDNSENINAVEVNPGICNSAVESNIVEASPCTDNTENIESSTNEVSHCTDNAKEVVSTTIEASPSTDNANEVVSSTIDASASTDNTNEVESSTIEASPSTGNATEVELGIHEDSPCRDNTGEVESSTIDASSSTDNTKEVESSTIDASSSTDNTKEVESSTIEASSSTDNTKEVEPSTNDASSSTDNTKEVESSTIEASSSTDNTKEVEPSTNDASSSTDNTKEVESSTLEASSCTDNANEVESSTIETKECIDNGEEGQANGEDGLSVDDTNIIPQCSAAAKPVTHDADIAKENITDPGSSSLSISDAEDFLLPESEASTTCCEPYKSGEESHPSVIQKDHVNAKGDATGHECDNDVFSSDICNHKDGQIAKEGRKSPNAGVDKSNMSNGTSTPRVGKGCDKTAAIKSNTVGSPRSSHEKHRHGHRRRRPMIKRTKSDSAADMACKFELPLNPGVITIYTSTTPSPKKDRIRPTSMSDMPRAETGMNATETPNPRYYARSPGVSPTKSATYQLVTETIAHLTQNSASEPKKSRSPRQCGRSKSRDSGDVTSPKHRSHVPTASPKVLSPSAMTTPKKTVPVATESPAQSNASDIAGAHGWNVKSRKAYGICMSLYDQNPVSGKISGEPIADAFAVCARKNSGLLIVADGVNWGEKSMLAARCAVYGCVQFIQQQLFSGRSPLTTTHEITRLLLQSLDAAQQSILLHGGGLTTLCVAMVSPLLDSRQFVVCIVNVGDSLAYVFSKQHGVREVTTGSHDISLERDIRDAGGALGPVNGTQPELHNLTCSMTFVDPGDIIYLTTDGISDNFDPVVTKIAVSRVRQEGGDNWVNECGIQEGKPEMEPHERHQYAVKEMERIIHEFELFAEVPCSAQELCGAILQHVLKLTNTKRQVLENPKLYGKKLRSKERKRRDAEIMDQMHKAPGKLDHATIVGYEIGVYHGNDDEDYEVYDARDELRSESMTSVQIESNV